MLRRVRHSEKRRSISGDSVAYVCDLECGHGKIIPVVSSGLRSHLPRPEKVVCDLCGIELEIDELYTDFGGEG